MEESEDHKRESTEQEQQAVESEDAEREGNEINDPLTRSDVEAPRKPWQTPRPD